MNATVSYLADRLDWKYKTDWYGGMVGVSSDAMLRQAIGGEPVDFGREAPLDLFDYARCRTTYQRAPRRLRRRMRPILREYRRIVRERQAERRTT